MKKFQTVPGPFGGIDEQATTEAFEQFMGGVARAQEIFRIYKESHPVRYPGIGGVNHRFTKSKEEVFAHRAKNRGFTDREIEALLEIV